MSTPIRFTTVVELGGRTATGLPVPDDVLAALQGGRRPPVTVRVGRHTYRTTIGWMGGRALIPLSAENRTAAGIAAGDQVEVEIQHDDAPREAVLPDDLAAALAEEPAALTFLESLAPSHRKEWVRWVEEAKRPETRSRRVAATVDALKAGQRTR